MSLSHARAKADSLRNADDEVRLRFLDEEQVLPHSHMKALIDELSAILDKPTPWTHNRAIFARSFNGKSTTARYFASLHPIEFNPLGDSAIAKVVRISMPAEASPREFAIRILQSVNEPVSHRWSGSHLMTCAYQVLKTLRTRMLIIDEMQDLALGSYRNRNALTNIIKSIGEDCALATILFSMPDGVELIANNPQLARRFEHRFLPPWEYGEEACVLLHNMEAMLPLRHPSNIASNPMVVREILSLGDGVIGHIRAVVYAAARTAIQTGREQIDLQTLKQSRWVPLHSRAGETLRNIRATREESVGAYRR